MIAKTYIQENLRSLDSKFRRTTSPKDSLYFSKLALLELCGWIEESMDDIALWAVKKYVKRPAYVKHITNDIIRCNYGFEYNSHFRKMLIPIIGIVTFERMEAELDPIKLDKLKAALNTLKSSRDSEAHTHIKGTARSIDAPSITLSRYYDIYAGLKEIEAKLRNMTI